jgi:hypothetical protein
MNRREFAEAIALASLAPVLGTGAAPIRWPGALASGASVEELAALEPAVRHALVRRYFDGWTAARIARETAEPAATVRWRLQRGLAELRVRLDRRGGGDGLAWRLALLPACGDPTPWMALKEALEPLARTGTSIGAGTITGALTMKAASQALAAGVVAAAVGLGVWWSVERDEAPRASAPTAAEAPAAELRAPERPLAPAPALAPAIRESVAAPAPRAADEPPVSVAAAAPLRIEGRCVDADLRPIAGARASQLGAQRDVGARELASLSTRTPERSTLTAHDGTFTLQVVPTPRGDCALELAASGHATRRVELVLPAEGTTYLGDVVLAPGGTVRGRVVDAYGAAVPGAHVAVTEPALWGSLEQARIDGPRGEWRLTAESGADGRFEIAGVETGPRRAWAVREGMRWAVSAPLEVRAREATPEVELVLEPVLREDRITGIVLSPDGAPIAHAGIGGMERAGGGGSSIDVACDELGRFELAAKRGYVYDLEALDPEDRWARVARIGVVPGTHDLELRFAAARHIEVQVRAGDEIVEDFRVVVDTEHSRQDARGPHADGATRIRVPGEEFEVRVLARGFAAAVEGPFLPDEAPGALTFALEPVPGLRGRVVADDRPLAGARVELSEVHAGTRIDHLGYPALVSPNVDDETRTDEDGRFVLSPPERGTYVVRAEADGFAPGDLEPLAFDPAVGADVELVLARPGALEGRVLVAAGRDPGGVIVALNRGDAHPLTVRSEPDGSFGFDGLTPGPWHLSRGKIEVNPEGGGTAFSGANEPTTIPFNVTVRAGETVIADLDLRAWEPCELAGTLRVNGAPARDWSVRGWPGGAQAIVGDLPTTAVASDGSFALTLEERGPVRLSFSPPAESGADGNIDFVIELEPGANRWEEDLALGRLSGRFLSPLPPDAAIFYNSKGDGRSTCWLPVQPDENGRFELPFVPVGKGALRRYVEEGSRSRWVTLAEIEVEAGAERSIQVP